MADYIIMTDSCCDLPPELAEKLEVLPLRLELKGREYRNFLDGREIGFQEFYDQVRAGETLALLNIKNAAKLDDICSKFRLAYETGPEKKEKTPVIHGYIL